jgi:hypothetical protein
LIRKLNKQNPFHRWFNMKNYPSVDIFQLSGNVMQQKGTKAENQAKHPGFATDYTDLHRLLLVLQFIYGKIFLITTLLIFGNLWSLSAVRQVCGNILHLNLKVEMFQ